MLFLRVAFNAQGLGLAFVPAFEEVPILQGNCIVAPRRPWERRTALDAADGRRLRQRAEYLRGDFAAAAVGMVELDIEARGIQPHMLAVDPDFCVVSAKDFSPCLTAGFGGWWCGDGVFVRILELLVLAVVILGAGDESVGTSLDLGLEV